jgi:hypothetical protein
MANFLTSDNTTTNLAQVGGANVALGSTTGANSIPVVIASDQGDVPVNIDKYGGTATTLGQKASAASIPTVIASDQSDIPVNIDKFGGTATTLGQKVMASSIPVVLASDQIPLSTNQAGFAGTVLTTSVSVGTTATVLPAASLANRKTLVVHNSGSATIFLGGSGVTTANGMPILKGSSFSADIGSALIYGIVASGTQTAIVMEIS